MSRPYDVIDAHCHYWEPARPDRPWDKDGWDTGPPLSVEQLLEDAAQAGVTKIVQVTPSIMGFDNRYAVEGAQRFPERVAGVIGRFDPTGEDVGPRLERFYAQEKILGLRLTLNKPPWNRWLDDGTLENLWREAARVGVPVTVTAAGRGAALLDVARRHPDLRLVLDHMGVEHNAFSVADPDEDPFARWDSVLALAGAPNTYVKVSCVPEVSKEPYPFVNVHRYVRDLYERFGPGRLMWGSDYPPSLSACSYKQSVDYVDELPFLDDDDKAQFFGGSLLRAVGVSVA